MVVETEPQPWVHSRIKQFITRNVGKSVLITIFSLYFSFLHTIFSFIHSIFSFPHTNRAVLQFMLLSLQNWGKKFNFRA